MWLSLFLLAIMLGAAYFITIQGLTSAAITATLTVLCLAISFGTYEYVAESFLMGIKPDYAYPVAFMGMFVVPLSILRVLMDMLISRNNLLPQLLDRILGAGFGFVAAFLSVGMLAITVQMVPWGRSFLGFQRFDPEHPLEQRELWLKPDRAAAAVGVSLSDGVFSGSRSFRTDHPDLLAEIGYKQAIPRGVRRVLPDASDVQLVSAGRLDYVYEIETEGHGQTEPVAIPKPPQSGQNVFAQVSLKLSGDQLADEGEKVYFSPVNVTVVGELNGEPAIFPAIAVLDPEDPNRYVRRWQAGKGAHKKEYIVSGTAFRLPDNNMVEVAFELPERFQPRFVEYKNGGRVPITKARLMGSGTGDTRQASASPPDVSPVNVPPPTPAPPPGGRVSGVRFKSSHFGGDLPLTLTAYLGTDTQIRGGALEQGHIYGALAEQGEVRSAEPVSQFAVPQGKRLLQLNVESLKAGSLAGKALNFATQTVENYLIETEGGKQYTPVGKYAVASVGGAMTVELQYWPEYASAGGRLRAFNKITNQHLRDDYQLVYLYLLDPGEKVVEFKPGGIKRGTDLRGHNLVAP